MIQTVDVVCITTEEKVLWLLMNQINSGKRSIEEDYESWTIDDLRRRSEELDMESARNINKRQLVSELRSRREAG